MHDARCVDLEEGAQGGPGVAAAKAVGAQRGEGATGRHKGPHTVGHGAHVVGRGHDGPLAVGQLLRHIGATFGAGRAVAGQLAPAGHAEHVHLKAFLHQLLGGQHHLGEDGAGAHERDGFAATQPVNTQLVAAADHAGFGPRRQAGLRVVGVHHGDVIEDVLLLHQHLAHAVVDDDGQFARVGRVVGFAVGDGGGDQVAGAVLVLQAFAAERGAPRRGAEQEAAGALVGRGPDLVAHALEAEHRVINVEGQHGHAVHAVAGGRGRPAGERAGLRDAFFQNLAVQGFAVAEHRPDVFGRVALALAGVDAHLLEQVGHAESARFVGHDGHDARAQFRVLEQGAQHAHKGHGGAHVLALGLQGELGVLAHGRDVDDRGGGVPLGHKAAQLLAPLVQVLHLGAVVGRFVEVEVFHLLVGQRQVEAVAERDEVGFVELLVAVGGHLALTGRAHAVAFFGLGQDDGGLAFVGGRGRVGGVDFHEVVAAAFEAVDLLVGHALGEALQRFVLAKEVVAVEAAVLGGEGLHLAVDRVGEGAGQRPCGVAGEEAVPVGTPHEFDHVPAGTGEELFQLVDDAAVAAHRAVEALQVAVDHPDQVVQPFAGGERQGAHALGLVHLAVTEHAPDFPAFAVEQLAV